MRNSNPKKILITGGGSGGHVSVASALIEGIREKYPEVFSNLIYVGGDLGMIGEDYGNSLEQKRFKNADFKCVYIRAGKLQRSFSISTIRLAFRTVLGFFDAFKILNQEKPDLIFSTGGFVSVPVCIAGFFRSIPVFLHEQTAAVGLANQIVGKFAKKIFTTFSSSSQYFNQKKVFQTGNIIREAVLQKSGSGNVVDSIKIMQRNRLPIIYISGGGLGSHKLISYILENIDSLIKDYYIILQMGDNQTNKDFEFAQKVLNQLPGNIQNRFFPVKYVIESEIGYMYNKISLYIGRAGANTVYEIGVLQIPSIFIPIPWVTHDEQTKNAQTLVSLGLSEILPEKQLESTNISVYIKEFLSRELGINMKKIEELFPTHALEMILSHIFN
jgi:UDP-N-acetylglucosamine--N-acetylmuramyl-(pentapeptide) pyrophosphoryl-undecaprenol N-acetylglucosamine transferase